MAASMLSRNASRIFNVRAVLSCNRLRSFSLSSTNKSDDNLEDDDNSSPHTILSFADFAVRKEAQKKAEKEELEERKSFAELFRKSEFVELGDFRGKDFVGVITDVVGTDLYIDFGGKFPCVCKCQRWNAE